jgi:hypothetical protein
VEDEVIGFKSPGLGARKFLVSSEKEFKDRHRGDKQKHVCFAKQNDRKAKVLSSDGRGQAREAEPVGRQRVCGQRCQSWETGLCVINFINL